MSFIARVHKYLSMATGYSTIIIAEARQRLQDILRGIDGVIKLQKQAKDNEQYNIDVSNLYVAARQDLLALAKDFDIFKKFILDNKAVLYDKESDYYAYKSDNIQMQIDYLEDTIIIPSLTMPTTAGASENSGEIGASFAGTIIAVSDGDTVIVDQTPSMEGGLSLRHTVRLAGIDCPEGGTDRGKMVQKATEAFWKDKEVTVFYDRNSPTDLYGRVLGTIYWEDINFSLWSLERCYTEPNLKFGKNHFIDPQEFKQMAKKCLIGWPPIGIIKVASSPTHATVYIGKVGEELKQNDGITPCEIELPVGMYSVLLSAPGCSSVRDEIEITAAKRQLPIYTLPKLSVDTGVVSVEIAPIGVRSIVSVDDSPVGIAPLSLDLPGDVPAKITVVFDGGYENHEETVIPIRGEIKRVVVIPRPA
jgi:endonuclease YncB( thermonuclease family)